VQADAPNDRRRAVESKTGWGPIALRGATISSPFTAFVTSATPTGETRGQVIAYHVTEIGPVHTNSIFVDGCELFPQMDVLSHNRVDATSNGSRQARRDSARAASKSLQEPFTGEHRKCISP
jgi:hypothetical protein